MITHAALARSSQRPRKILADGEARVLIPPSPRPCSFVRSVTTPLYSTTVSQALRQPLRGKGLNDIDPHHQPRAHGGAEDVEVGTQDLSPASVSMVKTPLTPSQSHEDRFSRPPWRF